MNIRSQVETILERKLTTKEVAKYRFYWTRVFMNSHDLAARIKEETTQ